MGELARHLFLQSDLGLQLERTPVEDLHRHRARGKASFHRQLKKSLSLRPWRLWLDLANSLLPAAEPPQPTLETALPTISSQNRFRTAEGQ